MKKVRQYSWFIESNLILTRNVSFNANDYSATEIHLKVGSSNIGATAFLLLRNSNGQTAIYESLIKEDGVAVFSIDNEFNAIGVYDLCFRLTKDEVIVESNMVSYSVVDGFEAGEVVVPENTLDDLNLILTSISEAINNGTLKIDEINLAIEESLVAISNVELVIDDSVTAKNNLLITIADSVTAILSLEEKIANGLSTEEAINSSIATANAKITELTTTANDVIDLIKQQESSSIQNIGTHVENKKTELNTFTETKKDELVETTENNKAILNTHTEEKIGVIQQSIEDNVLVQRQEDLEWRMDRLESFKLGDSPNPKLWGITGIEQGRYGYFMMTRIKPVGIENVVDWNDSGIFADFSPETTPSSYELAGQVLETSLVVGTIASRNLEGKLQLPQLGEIGDFLEVVVNE